MKKKKGFLIILEINYSKRKMKMRSVPVTR